MRANEEQLYLHIGRRIRELRENQKIKMTQEQLGDKVSLKRASITNMESGKQRLPIHVLYDICIALKVQPVDILPTIDEVTTNPRYEDLTLRGQTRMVTLKAGDVVEKLSIIKPKRKSKS